MIQVTHIENQDGDWEALYIDGQQIQEGHSVDFRSFMHYLQTYGVILYTQVEVVPTEVEFEGETFFEYTREAFPTNLPQDLTTLPGFESLT